MQTIKRLGLRRRIDAFPERLRRRYGTFPDSAADIRRLRDAEDRS